MILELLDLLLFYALGLLLLVGGALIVYARWYYGSLEKCKGLPAVVPPHFIGGSDPYFYKDIVCYEDIKRVKKYGPVFGLYEGRSPQIFVSDPELIRSIFIKDFDHFPNQRIYNLGHPLLNEMMALLPYDKHKVVKSQLSPYWTTGKIRNMSHQMTGAINDWVASLETKTGDSVYTFTSKTEFTYLTMDVLSRCVFGTKIHSFDDDNEFVKNVRQFSFGAAETSIWDTLALTFPFTISLRPSLPLPMMDFFGNLVYNVFKQRRENGSTKVMDVIDVMNEMIEKCSTPEYKKLQITEKTVMSQAILYISAGFETSSNTFSCMAYHLAKYPEIQDKLIAEVDAYLARHEGKIEHETIGELVYAAAVMNETLRMYPIMIRSERLCQKDWVHESGLTIKKGVTVMAPIFAVHYDPVNYPEPFEFRPERFLPENKGNINPGAYLGWGLGHHTCFGMKFAKDEMQLMMATVLSKFKFVEVPGQRLKFLPGRISVNYYENYSVSLVKREGGKV